jgi:hypothetical protein
LPLKEDNLQEAEMNEQIKLNYRNEIYENVNVKFIDIKTIQVKEIPLAIGIRYNDIIRS